MKDIVLFIKEITESLKNVSTLKGIGVACLMFGTVPVMGDSYSAMWKQYDEAVKHDKPNTAVSILHRIQRTAEQEKSYGNLLTAMVREVSVMREISPDSMNAARQRFLARQKEWKQTDGVLATLCHTMLSDELGVPRVDSLLASNDAVAYTKKNATAVYNPFIKLGVNSVYFDNDLISVIASYTGQFKELHDYYTATGNRRAACIAAALWIGKNGTLSQADSLINVFQDLPECGALAVRKINKMHAKPAKEQIDWIDTALHRWPAWQENNRLRNHRKQLTRPRFFAQIKEDMQTTDTDVKIYLKEVCNVKGVRITLRRENKNAKGGYDYARTIIKDIHAENDYTEYKDSVSLGRLPLGMWKIAVQDADKRMSAKEMKLIITDLKVLRLPLPAQKTRVVVVNAVSGRPVPGATIHITKNGNDKANRTLRTDDRGEAIIDNANYSVRLYATKGADNAMKPLSLYGGYSYGKHTAKRKQCSVFTDRAIYRPGQTVNVALSLYNIFDDKELNVASGDTVTVILRNTQYEEVERKQVVTDDFGGASVDFSLPQEGRNRLWHITTDNGSVNIRVEEYKCPTYDVTLEKPTEGYSDGDTMVVRGSARTYSGVPLANARVVYSVKRQRQWWCINVPGGGDMLLRDTVSTAADGTFSIRMPMILPKEVQTWRPSFYNIEASVDVTDNAGESHHAAMSLPIGNKKAHLTCDMSKEVVADSAITITPVRRNMAGLQIDGSVTVMLDGKQTALVEANKPYVLAPDIASGKHTLMVICEGDTVKNDFVAFRKSDTMPMVNTHIWCYQSADRFPTDGGEVWLQVGTSDKDVTVYYSVFSDERIITLGTATLSNSNITRSLTYKPEYGDGLTIAFAWVKDGQMYDRTLRLEKPLPQKSLDMRWTTFRDRLVPGQQEQWAVTITRQDGMPADARMTAVLYDKSLEQFAKHSWNIYDPRHLSLPYTFWGVTSGSVQDCWLSQNINSLRLTPLQFSRINETLVSDYNVFLRAMATGVAVNRSVKSVLQSKKMEAVGGAFDVIAQGAAEYTDGEALSANGVITAEADEAALETGQEAADMIPVRGDFAETAFFLPNIRTDAKGVATMTFTLPESVTTWRFMAVAHDKEMRNATLVADAVAQKPLMVQPNMPRFLRQGDNATITTTVANLSEQDENVDVTLTITDANTERKVMVANRKVIVKAGETAVVTFPVDSKKVTEGAYVCRFTAVGAKHTDGEQRMLQVLSDEELITNTVAYVFCAPVDTVLTFSDMIPKGVGKAHVKVGYVDNPAWLMMETLPKMAEPESQNAIVLSNALYANRVAAMLKWSESKSEKVLTALHNLQNADGSFSWWEGMNGSPYMTMAVIKTLARLNTLCGRQADTRQMMDKAFAYMQKVIGEDVNKLKQQEKKHKVTISTLHLEWLYALTLEHRNGGAAADWITGHVAEDMNKSSMEQKAIAAIVLFNNGKKTAARRYVDALKEHTVYRKDVGRYFDSYRAAYSWCDYRIPTQTLAIEALRTVTPQDSRTIGEMQRWLLSSKRTQEWDNAYNTVNAVHAFFGGSMAVLKDIKGDTILMDKDVEPKNATVRVRKQTDCESWAAAYITYKQQVRQVSKATTGLSVSRTVLFNGKTVAPGALKPGDKVTVRITITADRDYDFVTVEDNKAACIEPVESRSGYVGRYYKEQKDNVTLYHFNQMRKGTHTIETEYYIDRTGEYVSGTAKVVCAYANEFRGVEGAYKLNVK